MRSFIPPNPTHRAYIVTGERDEKHWTRVGECYAHGDDEGFDLKPTQSIPDGQVIVIRQIQRLGTTPTEAGAA